MSHPIETQYKVNVLIGNKNQILPIDGLFTGTTLNDTELGILSKQRPLLRQKTFGAEVVYRDQDGTDRDGIAYRVTGIEGVEFSKFGETRLGRVFTQTFRVLGA